jgi:very-short-patch-repair endonuclease
LQRFNGRLVDAARKLRASMTEAERVLWRCLRNKRVGGVRFYRQRPIGEYIVDFYAAAPRLVIEVDGGQHFEEACTASDLARDAVLGARGLKVLRFSNLDVLRETAGVVEAIRVETESRLNRRVDGHPLAPPGHSGL